MNLSLWLTSNLLTSTAALVLFLVGAALLRQQAAWEHAVLRALLVLLFALPVAQTLAPRMHGLASIKPLQAMWATRRTDSAAVVKSGGKSGFAEAGGTPVVDLVNSLNDQSHYHRGLTQGLICVWISGVVVSLSRLAVGLCKVRRLVHTSNPLTLGASEPILEVCAKVAGVPQPAIRVVAGLPSPVLVGWLHPCILIAPPVALPSEAVLLHELAHLKRSDLWWLCLGRFFCACWWFHPLAWMLNRRLELSAENACDDLVVLWTQDAPGYAEMLMSFVPQTRADKSQLPTGIAVAAYRSELGKRIKRMLEPNRSFHVDIGRGGLVSLTFGSAFALLVLTAVGAIRGQTASPNPSVGERPAFMPEERSEKLRHAAHEGDSDAQKAQDEAVIERKLNIVIPQVAFHAERLSDALEYLRTEARRLDTTEENPESRGINIFVKPGRVDTAVGTNNPPSTLPKDQLDGRVTLDVRLRPLREVLSAIAGQVGMQLKVEQYAASIVPLTEATEHLTTVQFVVPPAVLGAPTTAPADGAKSDAPKLGFDPRPWLERHGLTFPVGSSAAYMESSQKLVVRTTRENIERLKVLFPPDSQVK